MESTEQPPPPAKGRNALVQTLLAGVAVTVPFAITIAALWWLGNLIIQAVEAVRVQIGHESALPPWESFAIGLGASAGAFFLVGLLTRVYLGRKLVALGEWVVLRIPLAKSLYEATRDLMRFFGGGDKEQMGQVVRLSLDGGRIKLLGLLTNQHPRGAGPAAPGQPARVAVYLPMSYQLGGFTIYVSPDQVEKADLSVEQAMKIAATADVG